ncbi:VOC family protein [Streptomyces oryzae]|uniref:VOC family protein n=1 Tax=Streptomyces oryzae TaxID=1434886 RepID=A0ABS3XMD5_9ACTN|nr:VOC family protein [Streptomyces oryzae]MBO8196564.1 VOC family protein [Streptomyces oryzae]
MTIRRVVPDITCQDLDKSREFYARLGFEEVMNLGWVVNLASPSNPTAQVILMTSDRTAEVEPDLSIEVDDVDAAYATMVESGAGIVHELRDEPWGVRRFFALDPDGRVVNIVSHRQGRRPGG